MILRIFYILESKLKIYIYIGINADVTIVTDNGQRNVKIELEFCEFAMTRSTFKRFQYVMFIKTPWMSNPKAEEKDI